ncbi:GNAT family N-acetyltransferase [Aureitalea marina]|uniref:GNAT family N-acetyltransferase n=1 Tax=Aureitalea marina TaxID=930804 RepID=UPI003182C0B4
MRKATMDDVPVLLQFEQGLIQAERPMDPTIKDGHIHYYDVRDFIRDEDADLFVAELDGELVASGYAKIKGDRHYLKHHRLGYLGFMFVPPQHRGKGYNKLILDVLIQWCRERDLQEIRLDVYDVNDPAIRAYEKAGFVKHLINMRLPH